MLNVIRQFFERSMRPGLDGGGEAGGHALRLATAALLMEVLHADFEEQPVERETVARLLRQHFGLSTAEAEELLRLGEQEAREASSLFQFTALIDKTFSVEQKTAVVELMWRVAFADRRLDKHEEYLVRKVADLLHVPHRAFLQAKLRVQEALDSAG
ncbi:TerB family tellurite resistance protein [Thiohalobacter sp. IOR34]|uniref:tellurite resistance TerB family protein n=1 Tax=Thiohalobacter sp. IOR34 TaxID=3057176 RepID=UPI0025AFFC87|nr:TerB family tellurite resistance protein [Thiohalobacter sp. IOR34]WJW75830.1 TerB family tellurite resistance protein [Thiohalobacter sp. IOR34]